MKKVKTFLIPTVFLLVVLSLEGCTSFPLKRDFRKMFSQYIPRIDENPVIIIPGIIGSRLADRETGKMLWGTLRLKHILFLSERAGIALPIDKLPIGENKDTIASAGIIDKYDLPVEIVEFTVYRELLNLFEKIGYKLGDIRNPRPGDNLYIFDYDWRRDNVESAKALAERIENIKKTLKRPKLKFNLICHSMGGLIGRYYMRYGGDDVLGQAPNYKVTYKGARNIKKLILIGVPNFGSVPVFKFLHEGLNLIVVRYPPHVLFTMPSIYQLLPARHIISFVNENGAPMDVDLYTIENWKKYGWSIYSEKDRKLIRWSYRLKFKDTWEEELMRFEQKRDRFVEAALARADLFQNSLYFNTGKKTPCEIILFGGDTEWTLSRAILKQAPNGEWRTSFWDPRLKEEILMPGDSIVTRESLLGVPVAGMTRECWKCSPMDISFSLFVTQRHENIHKDDTFQDNLLHILLGSSEVP